MCIRDSWYTAFAPWALRRPPYYPRVPPRQSRVGPTLAGLLWYTAFAPWVLRRPPYYPRVPPRQSRVGPTLGIALVHRLRALGASAAASLLSSGSPTPAPSCPGLWLGFQH